MARTTTRSKRKSSSNAKVQPDLQIANQVFLGVPWRTVRPKYEQIMQDFRKRFPLSFVIVGREGAQDADDLFEVIKTRILTSSYAVFDATGGNANVSLEYGFAEANDVPRALYLSTHKATKKTTDSAIIADLAGKRQNRYAQEARLKDLLADLANKHPYTKRFNKFLTNRFKRRPKGEKKRLRALALKVVHAMSGDGKARRADVVQQLLADPSDYKRKEIDQIILNMHQDGLIDSVQGPYSTVTIR